jgi:hypothetical protein
MECWSTQNCGMQIADFGFCVRAKFDNSIRNLKSAINFAPLLQHSSRTTFKIPKNLLFDDYLPKVNNFSSSCDFMISPSIFSLPEV